MMRYSLSHSNNTLNNLHEYDSHPPLTDVGVVSTGVYNMKLHVYNVTCFLRRKYKTHYRK